MMMMMMMIIIIIIINIIIIIIIIINIIIITACTVVQAVVKANSRSNGKGQISTRWGSETPERISMKLGNI